MAEIILREPVSTQEGQTSVNLLSYFMLLERDNEEVIFTFTANVESGDDVVTVMVRDAALVIRPLSPGVATVQVSARYRGFVWQQSFEVAVTDECPAYLCRSTPSAWRWALPLGQGDGAQIRGGEGTGANGEAAETESAVFARTR